ncbi:hypothetical protein [Paenibacillus sp. FSL R7-0333]|uniref:hypothetical protein n=1 Tax=Paenibacillus sp. FSL R7-0333 TaxID=1926587 RepID=UPI00096C99EF|nr:hypothetical protein BK146_32365 [Paenibacillus sp. FSL R7-0333]
MITPITATTTDEERWALYCLSMSSRKMRFSFKGYESNFRILDYENPYKIEIDTLAVYCLKNAYSTILNVGASRKVRTRTIQKYNGKTSGSIADMYFKNFYCGGVTVCYVSSYADMLLLELEYINIYKPLLNYQKAFYDTSIYQFLTREYAKDAKMWKMTPMQFKQRMRYPLHDENFKSTVRWIENLGKAN